ncbi:hypothetical protein BGX21_002582 [Mortierella sp. AD011]|nr:hypothetical protein BGX20_009924 [Mortierella sp. AD010]KAF9379644.1 hypothetical protein BGX21_002582 [Mortierella sp. AD011]
MHRALQLEEVKTAIGVFLDTTSLIASASCCREWHDSFIPLLWQHLNVQSNHHIPSAQLEKNKHRILQLTIQSQGNGPYFSINGCSNLTRLILRASLNTFRRKKSQYHSWTLIVNNHSSTLKHISLASFRSDDYTEEFCEAVGNCTNLQSLTVDGYGFPQLLLKACCNITEIEIRRSSIEVQRSTKSSDDQRNNTRIQHVYIEEPSSPNGVINFLSLCPALRYLSWRSFKMLTFPLPRLASALVDGTWPQLEELDVDGYGLKDPELAKALGGINRLVVLAVPNSEFGSGSMISMGKHLTSIKTLNLCGCKYVSSSMIQSMLCSMTALESLSVGTIKYTDIAEGSAWTSLNLRRLSISINMENPLFSKSQDKTLTQSGANRDTSFEARQRVVYERLSSLTRLNVLDIQQPQECSSLEKSLDLRLISGLGALSSLRKLVNFSFRTTSQEMGMDEIEWIVNNWTSLRKIGGKFTGNPDNFYKMKRVLNSNGILVYD